MSSCDTACLFWQNNTAASDPGTSLVDFPSALEADIRATFRSAVSSPAPTVVPPPPHMYRAYSALPRVSSRPYDQNNAH